MSRLFIITLLVINEDKPREKILTRTERAWAWESTLFFPKGKKKKEKTKEELLGIYDTKVNRPKRNFVEKRIKYYKKKRRPPGGSVLRAFFFLLRPPDVRPVDRYGSFTYTAADAFYE